MRGLMYYDSESITWLWGLKEKEAKKVSLVKKGYAETGSKKCQIYPQVYHVVSTKIKGPVTRVRHKEYV